MNQLQPRRGRRSPCLGASCLTQNCVYLVPQVNWGSKPATDLVGCPTRVLFECNKTATHGNGGKGGCTACSECCVDYISDGKECDTCVRERCPKPDNCNHVLPKECAVAKSQNLQACQRACASAAVPLYSYLAF